MNLFGIGPLEILLVSIVAIIVVGPERFPQVAVQVARAVKYLRGYANDATSQLREEFSELTKDYENLRKEIDDIRGNVTKETATVTEQVSRVMTETKPVLEAPKLLDAPGPIVEPGGELPPDRKASSNGSQG